MSKKTERVILALALPIAAGLLSSCQDFEYADSKQINEIGAKEEFTESFVQRYGQMDPNHNWGFGDIMGDGETRTQVANKNEWQDVYHLHVPGWPDTYYKSDGTFVDAEHAKYHNSDANNNTYDDAPANVPGGDVTDEEVQYVSWWFRTHRNPGSTEIHWSDFYIQEVSSDIDRDMNGNAINFGARYIWNDQNNGRWKHEPFTLNGWGIDQLKVKTFEGITDINPDGYDHIFNFNSGASDNLEGIATVPMTSPWGDDNCCLDENYRSTGIFEGKTNKRLIAFYQNSGTEDFEAHYSNDEIWRSNFQDKSIWVVVHLHFTGASGRVYDGYYLGFDYAYYKEENWEGPNNSCSKYSVIYPDGYYSNWIVKIAPGTPITTTTETGFSRRIMCEDLGNSWDLDFDDVVFDATYNLTEAQLNEIKNGASIPAQGIDVTINLQAAGGTMPISVGATLYSDGTGPYEAHKLLGQGDNYTTPVNVANGASAPVANYHIKVGSVDPDDIPIYVYNTKIGQLITLNKANSDANTMYNTSKKTEYAPQKFAVPTSVLWMKETKQIEEGYGHFADWVGNASWSNNNGAWYADGNVSDQSKLCGLRGAYSTTTTAHTTNPITGCTVTPESTPAKLEYRLDSKTSNPDWGTVTATQFITAGQDGTITATPKTGYQFVQWSDGVTANPRTVTVTTLTNLMAYFAPEGGSSQETDSYNLNVNSNDWNMGWVEGGGQHAKNSQVEIKAFARDGYRFVKWNEDNVTEATRIVTLDSNNKTYTAIFEANSSESQNQETQRTYFTKEVDTIYKNVNEPFNLEDYMMNDVPKGAIVLDYESEFFDYNGQGVFTPKKIGTSTIKMTYNGESITVTVIISENNN